ncbi:MAG: hypothetical protein ACFB03_00050 [Paracoccaceae bacterium]
MIRPEARLPGVYFETETPDLSDELPRMDIAGFVGFAGSGPLHVPVPVDDLNRFRDIFGMAPVLAFDSERNTEQRAMLASAVEAFFANGGRRAWIVRVADEDQAVSLNFEVPGVRTESGSATARARSPGSWARQFALGSRLRRQRLFPAPAGGDVSLSDDTLSIPLATTRTPLVAGDLLELAFDADDVLLLAYIDEVVVSGAIVLIRSSRRFWLDGSASPANAPLGVENGDLQALDGADLTTQEDALSGAPAIPDRVHRLAMDLVAWQGARVSHILEDLGFAPDHPRFWGALPTDDVLFASARGRRARQKTPAALRALTDANAPRFPMAGPENTDLTYPLGISLEIRRDAAMPANAAIDSDAEINGLSTFSDGLFLDQELTGSPTQALLANMEARYASGFDASGLPGTATVPPLRGIYALAPVSEVSMVAVPDAVHRHWSFGIPDLDPPLSAPRLAPLPAETGPFGRLHLEWTAVPGAMRYQVDWANGRSFDGASRVETIETTEAIPVAREWPVPIAVRVRAAREGEVGPWSNTRFSLIPDEVFGDCAQPDPDRTSLIMEVAADPLRLTWRHENPINGLPGDEFELVVADAPTMKGAETVELPDPTTTEFEPDTAFEGVRYYRVRVIRDGAPGLWSETVAILPGSRLSLVLEPEDTFDPGTVTAIHRGLIRFAGARGDAVALLSLPRHFREQDVRSHAERLIPQLDADAEDSAAAGDFLVPALRFGEDAALSFAALYHPWIAVISGETGSFLPPDGPAAGLLAKRTIEEGAWISMANQPVFDAVALDPELPRDAAARLIAQQINPCLRDPRGFLFQNGETLSLTDELRPLSVRRLMILLRRLARTEGDTFVFEPNSPAFRAFVQNRFEGLLSRIHQRGGFAGDTPAESFNVITDESANPANAVDLGRLTIELRVAPSRPFKFLNVRLLQTGPEQISIREG